MDNGNHKHKNWINNLLSDLEMYSIHCIISSDSFHVLLNPVGVEAHVGVDPGVARPGAADAPAGEAGEEDLGALGVDQRPPAVPLTNYKQCEDMTSQSEQSIYLTRVLGPQLDIARADAAVKDAPRPHGFLAVRQADVGQVDEA